jgi:hypothetical protein
MRNGYWALLPLQIAILGGCGGHADLASQLAEYGYLRVSPPRPTLSPGSLISVDQSSGDAHVEVICWPDQAFPGIAAPRQSQTETRELKSNAEKQFSLEAGYLQAIKANAKYQSVEDITLTISNAQVLEYARADLYAKYAARTPECQQAVSDYESSNKKVYTVIQALQADVNYHIATKTNVGAGAGLAKDALDGLAAELGGDSVNATDMTISGKGIFWGLLPDVIKPRPTRGPEDPSLPLGPPLPAADRTQIVRLPALLGPDARSAADIVKSATPK